MLLFTLGMFIIGFPKLMRLQSHHEKVLKKFLPRLKKHLDKNGIDTGLYTLKWFFQCFLDRVCLLNISLIVDIIRPYTPPDFPIITLLFASFLGSIQYINTSMGFISIGRRKGTNSYGVQYSQDAQTIHYASW